MIVDAGRHIWKPSLRINVVELGSLNQSERDRRALTAVAAGEREVAAYPFSVREA
jgi:hypothetical protein